MTAVIIQALIIVLFLFVIALFSSLFDKLFNKNKDQFIVKAIDKVSSLLTSKIDLLMEQYKAGPWYLVVYTQDSDYPLWISNNNIRSIHPDAEHRKLIVKQFNGEDMVIENVENYELCAANEMCDYDM